MRWRISGAPRDADAHVGMWFTDSDVYKTLEAMAWR